VTLIEDIRWWLLARRIRRLERNVAHLRQELEAK
jgi:hypothetical protein